MVLRRVTDERVLILAPRSWFHGESSGMRVICIPKVELLPSPIVHQFLCAHEEQHRPPYALALCPVRGLDCGYCRQPSLCQYAHLQQRHSLLRYGVLYQGVYRTFETENTLALKVADLHQSTKDVTDENAVLRKLNLFMRAVMSNPTIVKSFSDKTSYTLTATGIPVRPQQATHSAHNPYTVQ